MLKSFAKTGLPWPPQFYTGQAGCFCCAPPPPPQAAYYYGRQYGYYYSGVETICCPGVSIPRRLTATIADEFNCVGYTGLTIQLNYFDWQGTRPPACEPSISAVTLFRGSWWGRSADKSIQAAIRCVDTPGHVQYGIWQMHWDFDNEKNLFVEPGSPCDLNDARTQAIPIDRTVGATSLYTIRCSPFLLNTNVLITNASGCCYTGRGLCGLGGPISFQWVVTE